MDRSTGIEIENIAASITREDLVEFIGKELKDENEINYILFPLPENKHKAFVCFKHGPDKAFLDRLVARNPVWSIKVNSRKQTYSCCTAEVDALIVASIPDIPVCIAMLQKDYGIGASYDKNSGKFVLKGMLHQLQCAQNRLDNIFEEQRALQGIEFLQIEKSDDTGVSRPWSEYKGRRDEENSSTIRFAKTGEDDAKGLEKDVRNANRSFVVDDRLESVKGRRTEEWNRVSRDSEYRSLPAFLPDGQRVTQSGTRHYEQEPKSLAASDKTSILPSFDRDRSNREAEPASLRYFSDATGRYGEDLRGTGDRPLGAQFKRSEMAKHSSLTEETGRSVWLSSERHADRRAMSASEPREGEDAVTRRRILDGDRDWLKERVYTPSRSPMRGEYRSMYTSETRTSPPYDLLPSRDSVSREDSTFTARSRSLNSDRNQDREGVNANAGSRYAPAFRTERRDIASKRLHSLPLSYSEVTSSRLDRPQSKHPGRNTVYSSEMSFTTSRPSYLAEERRDGWRDVGEVQDRSVDTTSENQTTLFLETYVTKYIMAVEKWSVQDIKRRYEVEIKVTTEPGADFSTVIFCGKHADQVEKASKKFATLYEETFNRIIQREVRVDADLPEVVEVAERVQTMYRIILITDVPGTVTLVGEFRDVMKAVDMLNGVQSEIEASDPQPGSGRSGVTSSGERSSADGRLDLEETLPRWQDPEKTSLSNAAEVPRLESSISRDRADELKSSSVERSFRSAEEKLREVGDGELLARAPPRSYASTSGHDSSRYAMTFDGGFQVYIYTGDITKLRVDAIVNAANSLLKNYAGVAGAIEDAGGPEFRRNCDSLSRSHGPLQVSEVVHTVATGDLRCHDVIHTVGPQWYFDSDEDKCAADLLATFGNVLNYAEQNLEANSVAVPAVGTGTYDIPVDLCARAIYGAVREFLEHSSSSSSRLKSLHVVNKDPGTTELIQAVFEGLRQLDLDQQKKTMSKVLPTDDAKLLETSSLERASRRQCTERKLLGSVHGKEEQRTRDETRTLTELERNVSSCNESDVDDDSESAVIRLRVDGETSGPPEAADDVSKRDFRPFLDSDSDEF